jgi:Mce-associated membrane protein
MTELRHEAEDSARSSRAADEEGMAVLVLPAESSSSTTPGPSPTQATGSPGAPAFRRWGPIAAVLGIALIALVVAGVLLGHSALQASALQADRATVVVNAEQAATDLTTINAGNATTRLNSLLDRATGPFRDQLVGYSSMFAAILQQGNVGSNGSVTASGVEKLDDLQAVVLVAVTSTVTNSQVPSGMQRSYRIAVSLEHVGTQWLVSSMDFVG